MVSTFRCEAHMENVSLSLACDITLSHYGSKRGNRSSTLLLGSHFPAKFIYASAYLSCDILSDPEDID